MRPLNLTVTGLRSYRTPTTVAFPDDWRLAAVVGPTGAGKSSLLEAIVYSLFGCGTVPGASQPTNLITDDSREMRVVFALLSVRSSSRSRGRTDAWAMFRRS